MASEASLTFSLASGPPASMASVTQWPRWSSTSPRATACSFMGAGADIYGTNTLLLGIIGAALIIPIFIFRHYIQDHGKWPAKMLTDLGITEEMMHVRKAGALPYLTIAGGALVVAASWWYFWG